MQAAHTNQVPTTVKERVNSTRSRRSLQPTRAEPITDKPDQQQQTTVLTDTATADAAFREEEEEEIEASNQHVATCIIYFYT